MTPTCTLLPPRAPIRWSHHQHLLRHLQLDRAHPDRVRHLLPEGGPLPRSPPPALREPVPPRGGGLDLLRVALRAEREAVGRAHASRVPVQHQGLRPPDPAPGRDPDAFRGGPSPPAEARRREGARRPVGGPAERPRPPLVDAQRGPEAPRRIREARLRPPAVPSVAPQQQGQPGVPACPPRPAPLPHHLCHRRRLELASASSSRRRVSP